MHRTDSGSFSAVTKVFGAHGGRLATRMFGSHGRRWKIAVGLAIAAIRGIYRYFWSRSTHLSPKDLVVLTGCDSGLGYSLAWHCLCRGGRVVAGVLQDSGEAAEDLRGWGATVLPLDLTDNESVDKFGNELERILKDDGIEFRALVNNAGVMIFGEFEWLLDEQIQSQFEVNLLGTMSLTRRLMPLIRAHRARLVNVTSHCALAPLPGLATYSATKAALHAWSTSLRVELAKYGVDVIMLIPGNFTKESNLMSEQKKHFEAMRSGMREEARRFYGDYFTRYAFYLGQLSGPRKLVFLENSQVYKAFEGALLDDRPSAVYKCEPWRYTFYHTLFRIAPTRARDWLIGWFIQMPTWNATDEDRCSLRPTSHPREDDPSRD